MTKRYYECHVTMLVGSCTRERLAEITIDCGWKFSAIDGDINLGAGTKFYATRQFNSKLGDQHVIDELHHMADLLKAWGAEILRRKVETVIFDDRSSLVKPCTGGCVECHLDDVVQKGFSENITANSNPVGVVVGEPAIVITTPSEATPNVITVNGEDYGNLSVMATYGVPYKEGFKALMEALARAKLGVGEGPGGSIKVTDGAREVKAYLVTDKMASFDVRRHSVLLANDLAVPSVLMDKERFDTQPLVEKFDD